MAVPCCQHELFNQIDNSILNPIIKYGINKDKFTEILTNGLRCLKLEASGYKVDMLEFTSLEHTAKNVVIRGIKVDKPKVVIRKSIDEYNNVLNEYNVLPSIDKL